VTSLRARSTTSLNHPGAKARRDDRGITPFLRRLQNTIYVNIPGSGNHVHSWGQQKPALTTPAYHNLLHLDISESSLLQVVPYQDNADRHSAAAFGRSLLIRAFQSQPVGPN